MVVKRLGGDTTDDAVDEDTRTPTPSEEMQMLLDAVHSLPHGPPDRSARSVDVTTS